MLLAGAPDALALPPQTQAPLSQDHLAQVQLAQVTIEQRIIIRIPAMQAPDMRKKGRDAALMAPAPPAPQALLKMRETKGPKCLKLDQLRGAVINPASGVTMVTEKDENFRAHFAKTCLPQSFYSGFYIEPQKDGALCAKRDILHARNGSSCEIDHFSKLIEEDSDD
jgi:hypothetical protein